MEVVQRKKFELGETAADAERLRADAKRALRRDPSQRPTQQSRDRSRIDTLEGARIWVGHGVLAHSLIKISALAG